MYWTCVLINRWGQETVEHFSGHKQEIVRLLDSKGIQIIDMKPNYAKFLTSLFMNKRLSLLTLANLFKDFHNLLETGMSFSQAIVILKDTSQEEYLKRVLATMDDKLQKGQSLAETFIEMKIFPWIVSVTLSAGEKAGRLSYAIGNLGGYFQQAYQFNRKLKQALIYPVIVLFVLITLMFFISLQIVPQLKNLLPENALDNPLTQAVLGFSVLIQNYFWYFLLIGLGVIVGVCYLIKTKLLDDQIWLYRVPLLGELLKESALAIYLLNLSILLKSGKSLLRAIRDLNGLDQSPVTVHFEKTCDYILGGCSFWHSIEQDPFFPKVISSTFRRAEEMTKLEEYSLNLSEYFQRRFNDKVDRLLHIIQPILLLFGGVFLLVIAIAFLFPVYGNLTNISGAAI